MKLLVLTMLLTGALAAPMQQSMSVQDDGSYQFYYETGKDAGSHSRSEIRHPDGVVEGKFSYEDPNGDIREVSYRADDSGYVANGDVSVEGAPKGQFPSNPEEENAPPTEEKEISEPQSATFVDQPNPELQSAPFVDQPNLEPQSAPAMDETRPPQEEEPKPEDDIKDLSLVETAANGPPEGFPQGYFSQNFQGLRRLPEPITEEETAPPAEEDRKEPQPEVDQAEELSNETVAEGEDPNQKLANEVKMFLPLRPFQNFAPQPVDSAMLHQPVYVFSYHNPDSYGYHYYF